MKLCPAKSIESQRAQGQRPQSMNMQAKIDDKHAKTNAMAIGARTGYVSHYEGADLRRLLSAAHREGIDVGKLIARIVNKRLAKAGKNVDTRGATKDKEAGK